MVRPPSATALLVWRAQKEETLCSPGSGAEISPWREGQCQGQLRVPTRLTLSVPLPGCHLCFHELCWVVFVWKYFAKSLAFHLLGSKLSSWERRQVQVLNSLWIWSADYPRDTFLQIKSSTSKIHGKQVRIQGKTPATLWCWPSPRTVSTWCSS